MAREYLVLFIPLLLVAIVAITLGFAAYQMACVDHCLMRYGYPDSVDVEKYCCEQCGLPYIPTSWRYVIGIVTFAFTLLLLYYPEIKSLIKKVI